MKTSVISFLFAIVIFITSGCEPKSLLPDTLGNDLSQDLGNDLSQGEINGDAQEASRYTYNIPERYYSKGILNMVKRARQIKEVSWMPVSDLDAFNSDYSFNKGIEVQGVPYSQPVYEGKFVIYDISLDDFFSETKNGNSPFYTKKGVYEENSTYYGMDCSAFVSYVWNCKNRLTASMLSEFGDYNGQSINKIQVGDALIRTTGNVHTVLVTGVKEDSNKKVTWIEITEQTPPLTKQTRYGKGELYSIDEFLSLYLNDGYGIYRNTDFRDTTPYTHSCASPVDDTCSSCHEHIPYKQLSYKPNDDGNITFEAGFAPLVGNDAVRFSYALMHIHSGYEKYITDRNHYIKLRDKPEGAETILLVSPGTFVSIFDKKHDSKGELWGKTRYNNKVGWLYLDSSEFLGGEVWKGEEKSISDSFCSKEQLDGYENFVKCVFSMPSDLLPSGKKLVIYAYDSEGNKYLIGEYSK